jgi:hypothetical protein
VERNREQGGGEPQPVQRLVLQHAAGRRRGVAAHDDLAEDVDLAEGGGHALERLEDAGAPRQGAR